MDSVDIYVRLMNIYTEITAVTLKSVTSNKDRLETTNKEIV